MLCYSTDSLGTMQKAWQARHGCLVCCKCPMHCATHGQRFSSNDPRTGVAPGMSRSRNVRSKHRCSMCPAIRINSRSWLRSSSTHEPSDPPLRVVTLNSVAPSGSTCCTGQQDKNQQLKNWFKRAAPPGTDCAAQRVRKAWDPICSSLADPSPGRLFKPGHAIRA